MLEKSPNSKAAKANARLYIIALIVSNPGNGEDNITWIYIMADYLKQMAIHLGQIQYCH